MRENRTILPLQVTQLGHVKDLATAFVKALGNPKASKQTYNISGERFVTFDGVVKACAKAAGAPEPELVGQFALDCSQLVLLHWI